ncbi:MAG: hypothetical protein ACKOET_02480 [Verrucomicrobiota bacterium]
MTRHCHRCGAEWTFTVQPGRGEACPGCRADLRVCLNCTHHDRSAAQQCRERRAEEVYEKDRGNFCEFFEMARRAWVPGGVNPREDDARAALRRLLGD